ncbi:MAG: hypothetical protein WC059_00955 [Candidatus Paceibacterota bacterium]
MTHVKNITSHIVQNSYTQKVIFRVLMSAFVVFSLIYLYFITSITFNVLARKSLETTVRSLGSSISELELTYLARVNTIDKNFALSIGFSDAKNTLFATRSNARVALR